MAMEVIKFKWEYKTDIVPSEHLAEELNKLGEQGWEVVSVIDTLKVRMVKGTHIPIADYIVLMKRPKIVDSPFTPLKQVNNKPVAPND